MANPVRVKLYGLFWTTKRRYVVQLVVAAALMAVLLGVWFFRWRDLRKELDSLSSPLLDAVVHVWDFVPYAVLAIGVLQVIEAVLVFRAFARKEAEPAAPPSPQPLSHKGEKAAGESPGGPAHPPTTS